jgi:hypothetical protein
MRRIIVVLAVCGLGSAIFASSALAAGSSSGGGGTGARPAAKAPKPLNYEICGSAAGCGFQVSLYKATKTFVEGGGEEGTWVKGAKGLIEMKFDNGCTFVVKKVKGTKNYAGEEPPGGPEYCFIQTVELIREI